MAPKKREPRKKRYWRVYQIYLRLRDGSKQAILHDPKGRDLRPRHHFSAAQAVGFYVSQILKEPWRAHEFCAEPIDAIEEPTETESEELAPPVVPTIAVPTAPPRLEQLALF